MNRTVISVLSIALVIIGASIIWAGVCYYDTTAGIIEGGAAIHQLDSDSSYVTSNTISSYARTCIVAIGIVIVLCGPVIIVVWDRRNISRKEDVNVTE